MERLNKGSDRESRRPQRESVSFYRSHPDEHRERLDGSTTLCSHWDHGLQKHLIMWLTVEAFTQRGGGFVWNKGDSWEFTPQIKLTNHVESLSMRVTEPLHSQNQAGSTWTCSSPDSGPLLCDSDLWVLLLLFHTLSFLHLPLFSRAFSSLVACLKMLSSKPQC